jgi:hypothetical protein
VPDVLASRLGVAPNEILLESLVPLSYPMVYRSSASMRPFATVRIESCLGC